MADFGGPASTAAGLASTLVQGGVPINLATTGVEAGAPAYRLTYTYGAISDGGTPSTYYDHTMQLGFNMASGGGRVNSSHPSFGIQWESKFRQNSTDIFGWEWHVRAHDTSDNERRPISIFGCHDAANAANAENAITFQANTYTFNTWTGAAIAAYSTGGWSFQSGIAYQTNNLAVASQKNAAGNAFLPLPYFDATDKLLISGPAQITGASSVNNSNAVIAGSFTASANHNLLALSLSSSVAGAVGATTLSGATTGGDFFTLLQQSGASGNSSHCVNILREISASGGDPYTKWEVNGVTSWSCGLNNSASDAWQLAQGGNLGAETGGVEFLFALPTAVIAGGVAGSSVPWRIPSYTLALLPALRAGDAGALAYCSNATAGATIVCWNGTAWKIVAALGATVS